MPSNKPLHRALANVWRQLAADREVRVVILTGAGRAFSAGGDLDWIASFLDDPAARDESVREGAEIIEEMLRFPLPVIAAVNGAAVGLGASLAILSDVVLISEAAYLADPHVAVGLVAGDGGAALWPLLAPLLRVREYLYTGERIPAATAVEFGLASRIVAPEKLAAEARSLADRMAQLPAPALEGTKRVLAMHLSQALSGPLPAGFAASWPQWRATTIARGCSTFAARRSIEGRGRSPLVPPRRAVLVPGQRPRGLAREPDGRLRRGVRAFPEEWFQTLRRAGYAVPRWPKEWGGGMSVPEQNILYGELATHDAPRRVLAFVAIHHAASTLLVAGSDEQRRRRLPAILDGEIWVQALSEPEAGSDLAALKTTARRRGDTYVVNGQKVWASGAHFAQWCLLLVRTDPAAPKRHGISYLLMDMATPGIEIRPIRRG